MSSLDEGMTHFVGDDCSGGHKDDMLPLLFHYSMPELLGAAERQRDADWEQVKQLVASLEIFWRNRAIAEEGVATYSQALELLKIERERSDEHELAYYCGNCAIVGKWNKLRITRSETWRKELCPECLNGIYYRKQEGRWVLDSADC